MGADMCVAVWAIRAGKELKLTKKRALSLLKKDRRAIERAKTFDKDFMDFDGMDSSVEEARKQLLFDIDEVWHAVQGSREATWIYIRGYELLTTGGQTWGDPPTELYNCMAQLQRAGFLKDDELYPGGPWGNNEIQFPRLISELQAAGAFTEDVVKALCDSMDLSESRIFQLVRRADKEWERVKEKTFPPGSMEKK